MASITPILMQNNTAGSTTSTTEVDLSRQTAALANGVEYLVLYYLNGGGSDTTARPELNLRFGASASLPSGTRLGHTIGEGRGTGDHWDSSQLQGVCKVTGDGSSVLGFTGSTNGLGSDTCHFGAAAILAIPLTEIGSALQFNGTDSDADEQANVGTASMTTIRTVDFTLPVTGDYLVVMSMEVSIDGTADTDGYLAEFEVDGTRINPQTIREEWENAADIMSPAACQILNLTSGSHTFRCRGQSQGSASCDFGRSRIAVLQLTDIFDQWIQTVDATEATVTATTYGTSAMLSTTYTPNQQEYVLILGNWTSFISTTDSCVTRIRNTTDSTSFCEDAGEYLNKSATEDDSSEMPMACEQISAAKTYEVQMRTLAGTASYGDANVDSRLIFLGLTTQEEAPLKVRDPILSGGVVPFRRAA